MSAVDRRHPDFEQGNKLGLRHGAFSSRVTDPVATRLVAELEASAPEWIETVDRAAVDAWARAESQVEVVDRWLTEHGGPVDDKGKVRPAADLLVRLERRAADARTRLGLDPLARARLGRDTASARLDLARYWAEQPDGEGQS